MAPDLNLGATAYTELVDVKKYAQENDVEPPCISSFSTEQLNELLHKPLSTGIPCHTQSTERSVKLTTEAAAAVAGTDRQDGYSLNKVAFRRRLRGE